MRQRLLSTPVPDDNGGRIGGGRVLPLYESERLIAKMELRDEMFGSQWQWPGKSAFASMRRSQPSLRSPQRPSTVFADYIGRGDVAPTPSRPTTAENLASSLIKMRGSSSLPAF